jgi:hypothetical protein
MRYVRLVLVAVMVLGAWPAAAENASEPRPGREAGWLLKVVKADAPRLAERAGTWRRARVQAPAAGKNWIKRHPVLTGALVGFGAGFLIGYLPGDDGVFYDFTAEFNGMVLGGIGAGAGAVVGALAR